MKAFINFFVLVVQRSLFFNFFTLVCLSNIKNIKLKMFKYVIQFFFSIFFLKICRDAYFEKVNSFDKVVSMMLFCFMFGFYIGQRSVPLFIERWKLFIEIESLFNYYNGRKIIHELIYSDQRPKKIWVVWTWFDVIHQWF